MAKEVEIKYSIEWKKEQTDLSNCSSCGDQMFSDMNRMFIIWSNVSAPSKTDCVICNSCKGDNFE